MALSLSDRLILATVANCNECEAGFPEDALYADSDNPRWQMYFAIEGRQPPSRADLAGRIRELIADGFVAWRRGGPVAHMLPAYSGMDSEGLALTDAGKKEAESFDSWLDDAALVARAAEFAESHIVRSARALPFKPIIPAYLPKGLSPLPEIDIDPGQLRLTYYADDCHIICEQGVREREPWLALGEAEHEETLAGVPTWVKEGQMTSIWAAMTFRWPASNSFCQVAFNWINRVWTERPNPPPVVLDDKKRQEARKVVSSIVEQAD